MDNKLFDRHCRQYVMGSIPCVGCEYCQPHAVPAVSGAPAASFAEWYDVYERDGGELMLFNTIDLEAVWDAATAAERERCARIAEGIEKPAHRHWVPGSLYETIRREVAALIRISPELRTLNTEP